MGSNTQWNGTDIIDGTPGTGGAVSFHVGTASQTVSHVADIEVANAGDGNAHTAVATFQRFKQWYLAAADLHHRQSLLARCIQEKFLV